jgi:hypothetical protein
MLLLENVVLVCQIERKVCKYVMSFRVCFVKWGRIIFLDSRSNFCIRNSRYHSAEGCQILENTSHCRNKWRASHMNFKTTVCIAYTCPGSVCVCVYIYIYIYILHTSINLHKLFCIFNWSEIVLSCLISVLKHSILANCSRTNGCAEYEVFPCFPLSLQAYAGIVPPVGPHLHLFQFIIIQLFNNVMDPIFFRKIHYWNT